MERKLETKNVEEQARIILEHLQGERVDPSFLVRHAEALLGFAVSAEVARASRQTKPLEFRITTIAA